MPGIVPSNTYPCLDERWVAIGANSDAMFVRLMRAIGRDDLAEDPTVAHNDGRSSRATKIDAAIVTFTEARSVEAVLEALREAQVAVGPINSIEDIANDPHFAVREVIERHQLEDGREVAIPAASPKLTLTPALTKWLGPELGEHTEAVLRDWLGDEAS